MYQAILGTKLILDLNYSITIADYVSIPVKNNNFFFNPLNAELNAICKSQLAELFCGVFKFCA